MLFLSYYYIYRYDIFTEIFTPDPKALLAFIIGGIAGLLGAYLRFVFRYNKSKDGLPFFRDGDIFHYIGWPAFGALFAVTVNTIPAVSFILGVFAPLFYKALEETIKSDPSRFIPFLKKGDKKE